MTPMLGDSIGAVATTTTTTASGGGCGGGSGNGAISGVAHVERSCNSNSGEEEEEGIRSGGGEDDGDRSIGSNRWPRQETLALLKIRADMDAAFHDASVKGPLWDEVSRKLAELGYHRSAKNCREKFENVSKYHKRTKEGRTGKQLGKTYRFSDQLEALQGHSSSQPKPPPSPLKPQAPSTTTMAVPIASPPPPAATSVGAPYIITMSSATTLPSQGIATTAINLAIPWFPSPASNLNIRSSPLNFPTPLLSDSTSSSTSLDVEIQRPRRGKRKWKDLFERLMREVMNRQEDMQKKFLEAIEKREHGRMVREEAWRAQEIARIKTKLEILSQERSIAAAKDAAVMAFLQKLSQQQHIPHQQQLQNFPQPQQVHPPTPSPSGMPQPELQPQLQIALVLQPPSAANNLERKSDDGDQSLMPASSSRWPKVEIEALINLRTNLEWKYQENGPKGPLWEDISNEMRKLGYNRNAKRCKEKWENINKYFKKMKESNKRKSEDSKTCPYFHQLDSLYNEKHRIDGSSNSSSSNIQIMKPDQINSVPLMVQPEQQWPPLPPHGQQGNHDTVMEDFESEDNQNYDDDKTMDDHDEGCGYEIAPNRPTPISTAG